jgi:hypothetical protein
MKLMGNVQGRPPMTMLANVLERQLSERHCDGRVTAGVEMFKRCSWENLLELGHLEDGGDVFFRNTT